MKQRNGSDTLVSLVAGRDDYMHFTSVGSPEGWLTGADFERCAADSDLKRSILFEGADSNAGQRYRKS